MNDEAAPLSPLSQDVLAAIGRVVTNAGAIEGALHHHLAKLMSIRPNPETQTMEFDRHGFVVSWMVLGGQSGRETLNDLSHVAELFSADAAKELRTLGEKLELSKRIRDNVAHHITGMEGNNLIVRRLSTHRKKLFEEIIYSVDDLHTCANEMKRIALRIDEVVTQITGLRNSIINEALGTW
ncbi:hypothetical protein [Mesorhizobium sp. M7A.F.Ca.MR.362.00.0.0]|uniref:hypothetical protein n=1 Tax=Mesorhizobium sp. M7A.F.Ca.MR.362.00.0.0 TaxID=2496779 RepID=UPI000FD56E51|nr:hypothetical protein [Mesorhizobium sp. M7A.F.Ca.MR.362.00.0.0]RUU83184.1 hypothetical protein EOC06_01175 [Mesorhizobium sp. M7A.F.Ca.MR.362.00.0.0]RWN88760.1 MAG: hypothetical protein EOS05_30535 [Mesorhizobium sp.]